MTCERCGKEHDGTFATGRFCSRACANSRGPRTKEFKLQVSSKLSGAKNSNYKDGRSTRETYCSDCGKRINWKSKTGKCKKCLHLDKDYRTRISMALKGKAGGYRPGAGSVVRGWYKGFYCGSALELIWLAYQLDQGQGVRRFPGQLQYGGETYVPDFLLDGRIIEIKGSRWRQNLAKQLRVAAGAGYDVEVLGEAEIMPMLPSLRKKYRFDKVQELFEDFEPIKYVCPSCGIEFTSSKLRKYCSRKCAGKGVRLNRASS
jgi:Zn finger protein HypA/HybF involved in hydrogenase expression